MRTSVGFVVFGEKTGCMGMVEVRNSSGIIIVDIAGDVDETSSNRSAIIYSRFDTRPRVPRPGGFRSAYGRGAPKTLRAAHGFRIRIYVFTRIHEPFRRPDRIVCRPRRNPSGVDGWTAYRHALTAEGDVAFDCFYWR